MPLARSSVVNLGLVALALASALVLFLTRERPTTDELRARENNLVPVVVAETLERALIEQGSARVELRRLPAEGETGARYVLGANAKLDADPEAVRAFVRSLELAAFLRKLERVAADDPALGLDAPRARLELGLGAIRGEIRIGKPAPATAGASYVGVRGFGAEPRVGLVRDDVVSELLVREDALRPHWLISVAPSQVRRITLRPSNGAELALERVGPAFRRPGGERVARGATDSWLEQLTRARLERVLASPPEPSSLEHGLAVALEPLAAADAERFELGGACPNAPELVAFRRTRPSPIAGCVVPPVRELGEALLASAVDRSLIALRSDEIERVRLELGDHTVDLRRHEKGFLLEAPGRGEVELEAGNRWLAALVALEGERLAGVELATLGLAPPAGTLELESRAIEGHDRYLERLELGREATDGSRAVRRAVDGVVLRVAGEAARALTPDPARWRSLELLDFGPSELKSLLIERGSERQRLRRAESGVFELVEPPGFSHDAELLLGLIQALGTLRADRWAGAHEASAAGLARPAVRLVAELARDAGPSELTLTIGAQTDGGYFASLSDRPGVFVLPASFVHDASTLLLARDVFLLEPSSFDSLELVHGARRLRLELKDGTWTAAAGSPELAPPALERLLASVSSLRAEAALHTGPAHDQEGLARPFLRLVLRRERDAPREVQIAIGAETSVRGISARFARRSGIDATYALPASAVRALSEVL